MFIRTVLSRGLALAFPFLAALAGGVVAALLVGPEGDRSFARVEATSPTPMVNRTEKTDRSPVPAIASPLPLMGGL
jgi:hypothetical protein